MDQAGRADRRRAGIPPAPRKRQRPGRLGVSPEAPSTPAPPGRLYAPRWGRGALGRCIRRPGPATPQRGLQAIGSGRIDGEKKSRNLPKVDLIIAQAPAYN